MANKKRQKRRLEISGELSWVHVVIFLVLCLVFIRETRFAFGNSEMDDSTFDMGNIGSVLPAGMLNLVDDGGAGGEVDGEESHAAAGDEEDNLIDITVLGNTRGTKAGDNKDIVIQVTVTEPGQQLTIRKYFANAYTIDRGDNTALTTAASSSSDAYYQHIYESGGTYDVTLSLTNGYTRWTFYRYRGCGLVPLKCYKNGGGYLETTVTNVIITLMPSLEWFGDGDTNPGDYFFLSFNNNGAIIGLPEGSFDTSNIESVGDYFFSNFNNKGLLTELPANSFNISNIESVGNDFFSRFNIQGALIKLPENSFKLSSNLVSVGNGFFQAFNGTDDKVNYIEGGKLTELPAGSFDTSNIESAGNNFFSYFNSYGELTELPENSFNTSNIELVGYGFFLYFNNHGNLISLPEGSFDTSSIVSVGTYNGRGSNNNGYFQNFNYYGAIVYLPDSFTVNSIGVSKYRGYEYAFYSPDYTLNRNVSDLVAGIDVPSDDKNMFSDNQPGRCGVHGYRLDSVANACSDEDCGEGYHGVNNKCVSDDAGVYYEDGYIEIRNGDKVVYVKDVNQGATQEYDFGTYYYRGNNVGATYAELGVDNFGNANVSQEAYNRGFNGGVMGEDEDNGWIEGNVQDNPCNGEGEYLPTYENWKDAMELWSDINGYDLYSYNDGNHGYFYPLYNGTNYLSEFFNDLLIPDAGHIEQYQEPMCYNTKNTKEGKLMSSLAMLFSTPVYAFDVGGLQMVFNGRKYLHMALDSGNNYGDFDGHLGYHNLSNNGYSNSIAAPVRCFIDPDYLAGLEWHTVTFKDGDEELFTKQVKKGKTIKNLRNPTKEGYGFAGWYTDKELSYKFDVATPITGNITLYAKWAEKGIYYRDGYIKVTNGNKTYYVSDRNVGAIVSQGLPEIERKRVLIVEKDEELWEEYGDTEEGYNLYMSYVTGLLGVDFDSEKDVDAYLENPLKYKIWYEMDKLECNQTDVGCTNDDELSVINVLTNKGFTGYDEAWDYVNNYNPYNPEYGEVNTGAFGNYYFRGNNNGVDYNDLEFKDEENPSEVVNIYELEREGFTGGVIGEIGKGWIEGNTNPCDGENEYMPTGGDWKNLMEIWGDINGYKLEDDSIMKTDKETNHEYMYYNYYFPRRLILGSAVRPYVKFQNDMLIPGAGSIYRNFCKNGPCEAADTMDLSLGQPLLRISQDGSGDVGSYDNKGGLQYSNNQLRIHNDYQPGNYDALPVRCFLDIEEPEDVSTYTITFITNGGSSINDKEVEEGYKLVESQLVTTRNGYTFLGWYTDRSLTIPYNFNDVVDDDIVLYAKWEKDSNKSSNGGGSNLKRDNCPGGDYSNSYYDGDCGTNPKDKEKNKEENKQESKDESNNTHHSADEIVYDTLTFNPHYSDEMNQAYQYAYHYGITTKTNIRDAAMNQQLTRIAMAKMLSQYAVNVLGIKPDTTRNNEFADVSDKLDTEYDDGVTLAYQLGIMGINMPNNEFRPYNYVTRGEFATALSRLLYHTSDGMFEKTSRYYVPHINKLAYEGILTNTDPAMKELRGYVMLMLMRSAK